jgi:hypothetical protein
MADQLYRYGPTNEKRTTRVVIDPSQTTAFGGIEVSTIRPEVQIDAVYGTRDKTDTEVFTATGGSVTAPNTGTGYEYKCSTGTNVGGYGLIRSRRAVSYRPGEGILMRWTARFDTPVALSAQRAGGISSGVELSFGYNGTDFGVLYRTGGSLEIQTLTITTPASGAETATITLAGTAYNVSITSGTAAHNAFEIATDSQFARNAGNAWVAQQNGDTVVFLAQSVGDKTGTMSFSSTGAAAGSMVETAAGASVQDTFVNQEDWNIDKMDGTGPSRMTLDHQKGNVYQIRYQYLGYGAITYYIEDDNQGTFVPVHKIQYANNFTSPSLTNPALKIGWFAASLGSTTDLSIHGASGMIAVEGQQQPRRLPDSQVADKSGIGTSFTNVLTIRNRLTFQGRVNLSEALPTNINIAVDGTKISEYQVILNATLAGEPNWTFEDEDHSIVEYDTAGTTATLGSDSQLVIAGVLGKTASTGENFIDYDLHLIPGDTLTIAVKTTSGTTDAAAAITWLED